MLRRRTKQALLLLTIPVGMILFGVILTPEHASAAINPTINFQGKLTNPDGTNVTNGSYSIRFRIYNDPTLDAANSCVANSCKWEETQGTVSVSDGIFRVALGSSTTLPGSVDFNSSALYLGIKVGSDAEMTPRIRLTASPYAFNSDSLDGLDSANFIQLAQGVQNDSSTTASSIFINKTNASGSPNILQLQKAGSDVLLLSNTGSLLLQNTADSTTALQVKTASPGASIITVDTATTTGNQLGRVTVGEADTNGTLLVVDTKTDAGDPTGTNGAIYYNAVAGKMRCFQNGAWKDCITDNVVSNNSYASFWSGRGNVAANQTGLAMETIILNNANAISSTAGVTGFTAPAAGSFRSCLVKNNAAITAGTFAVRWRVNGVSVGSPACAMDSTNNREGTDYLDSGVVSFAQGDTIGVALDTNAGFLPAGSNDFSTYWSVDYYSSSGNGITLQYAYDNSSPAAITTADNKDITFNAADTATDSSVLVNLQCATCSGGGGRFAVQNAGTDVFTVAPITGNITATGLYNTNTFTSSTLQFGAGGAATVDSASGQALQIGTGANAHNVTVGNTTGTSQLTLQSGTGILAIQNQGIGAINIGNNAVDSIVNIGQTGASANTSTVAIGTATGAIQGITIGSASNTASTLLLQGGSSASAVTIQTGNNGATAGTITVGNSTGAVTQAINIGTNATASSTTNITVGSTIAGTTLINGDTSVTGRSTDTIANTTFTITNGGTGNLLKIVDSGSATPVLSVADGGAITVQNQTNSTAALRVLNSTGGSILSIDTTGANANNVLTNPSIESAIAGNWVTKGTTPTTFAQDSTQFYNGANSLKVTTQATANQGARQVVTLTTSTRYVASFYMRLDPTSTTMSTLAAGYSSDGATDNTPCTLNNTTVTSSGWTRYTCSFTTPASNSGSPFFYIKQTDAVIHTFYIDAVLLQTEANTDNNYRDGKVSLQGTLVSPLILQNATNSSTAFTVQNASGNNIFTVDTTDTNLITNPGFEVNSVGWAVEQGTGSVSRITSQSWLGQAALNVTTSSTANAGAKFVTGNTQPTQLALSTNYSLSWYARLSAGTFTDIKGRYSPNGGGVFVDCIPSTQTVATTGWTRFTCSFNSGATAVTAGAYIAIVQTATGTARTFYIDGVQLELGTAPTSYAAGSVSINGIITSPINFKNTSDSTSAFAIQNSASTDIFQVDTLNNRVYIGDTTADGTGTQLVLDTKNTTGDPTGVAGGMYYNSFTNTFRCFEGTAWTDCISHHKILLTADRTDNAGACTYTNITDLSVAVTNGVTVRFHGHIIYTSAATTTGLGLAATGPAASPFAYNYSVPLTTNTFFGGGNTGGAGSCSTASVSNAATGNTAQIDGVITPTANGTLQLTFASEVNGSAIVIKTGSTLEWW